MAVLAVLGAAAGGTAVAVPAAATFPGANGAIVFQREQPAGDHTQTDIYAISPNGQNLRRLTATPNLDEFEPQFNASGTRIAFWRTKAPFGYGSVWVMNADGTHQRRLTSGIDARNPSWSPSGRRIVFARADGPGFDLWTMGADGGHRRRLTSGPAEDFEPSWSPDGTRIAFTRGFQQGSPGRLAVLTLATGAVTRLTHSALYDHQVDWSPDSRLLVFERDRDSTSAICAVPATGGPVHRLFGGKNVFVVGPAYSPDGRRIAFGLVPGNRLADYLWVMRADGSNAHSVRRPPVLGGVPDWQPLPEPAAGATSSLGA